MSRLFSDRLKATSGYTVLAHSDPEDRKAHQALSLVNSDDDDYIAIAGYREIPSCHGCNVYAAESHTGAKASSRSKFGATYANSRSRRNGTIRIRLKDLRKRNANGSRSGSRDRRRRGYAILNRFVSALQECHRCTDENQQHDETSNVRKGHKILRVHYIKIWVRPKAGALTAPSFY